MQDNSFDAVVLDMPASGEALRYLYLPKLVGNVGRKAYGPFRPVLWVFQNLSDFFSSFCSK